MKVSCVQDVLSKNLSSLNRIVHSRSSLPITQSVLMETDNGSLKLSSTNLEVSMITWLNCMVLEEGAVAVPSKIFVDFVNSLNNDRIDLDTEVNFDGKINVKCGRNSAQIATQDPEHFPPVPSLDKNEGDIVKIDSKTLKRGLLKVIPFVANNESRPVLTGVNLSISQDNFTLASADGFRLAVFYGKLEEFYEKEINVIIPVQALNELSRLLSINESKLEIVVNSRYVLFKVDNVQIVTQLIEGTFPNYSSLIPSDYSSDVICNLQDFSDGVKLSTVFAKQSTGIVRLNTLNETDEELEEDVKKLVICGASEGSGENKSAMEIEFAKGEEVQIAFNSLYLLGVLNVLDKGDFSLQTSSNSSPGVFRSVDVDDCLFVVMPMFVQW